MSPHQNTLFQHIRAVLPANLSMADELADILDISMDSAYRRIRGEKAMDIDELSTVCRHFKISLDQVLNLQTSATLFSGEFIEPGKFSLMDYLDKQLRVMQQVASFKDKEVYFFSKDLPIWYHYMFPNLAAFKVFSWVKTLLDYNPLPGNKFSLTEMVPAFAEKAQQIARVCCQLPTYEIMNVENIHITLRQFSYFRDTAQFASDEDIREINNDLEKLVDHMEAICRYGKKFMPGLEPHSTAAFCKVYTNDVTVGDNSVLYVMDGKKFALNTFSVLNMMTTQDERYCNYQHDFLHKVMHKSTLISEAGERERTIFFNGMRRKIEEHRRK
jgi:hypothetical protein